MPVINLSLLRSSPPSLSLSFPIFTCVAISSAFSRTIKLPRLKQASDAFFKKKNTEPQKQWGKLQVPARGSKSSQSTCKSSTLTWGFAETCHCSEVSYLKHPLCHFTCAFRKSLSSFPPIAPDLPLSLSASFSSHPPPAYLSAVMSPLLWHDHKSQGLRASCLRWGVIICTVCKLSGHDELVAWNRRLLMDTDGASISHPSTRYYVSKQWEYKYINIYMEICM